MPDFQRIAQDAGGKVTIVGVNPQSNDDDASQAALVANSAVTYPTLRDRNDTLLRVFNTSGALPTTVFLDSKRNRRACRQRTAHRRQGRQDPVG